jgi:Arc/MetJ family transcription regulator
MANPNQNARSQGTGRYVRTISTAESDREAARLRGEEGLTYQQIATTLGYSGRQTAYEAVQRAIRDIVGEPAKAALRREQERLDMLWEEAETILRRDHVMVSHGHIIKDDDHQPILDDRPKLAAIDRLTRITESWRKLHGMDAAVKIDATVHEVTQADIELASLIREAQAKNAVEEARIKDGNPE